MLASNANFCCPRSNCAGRISRNALRFRGARFLCQAAENSELEQRTQEWHDIRKDRLTASTFSSALGMFKGKRVSLWQEKVGLSKAFQGNTATRWGVENEARAVEQYRKITGHLVDNLGFKIYKVGEDDKCSWLGASPDGLIEGNESELFEKKGVLEVKCPHMRGRTSAGLPWSTVPHYYIPQAQGLLEILDREWMDFFVWTGKASASFRVTRDPEYWNLIVGILGEFWWQNVIPARKARDSEGDFKAFKPAPEHSRTKEIVKRSKELAASYPMLWHIVENSVQPLRARLNVTLSILSSSSNALAATGSEEGSPTIAADAVSESTSEALVEESSNGEDEVEVVGAADEKSTSEILVEDSSDELAGAADESSTDAS